MSECQNLAVMGEKAYDLKVKLFLDDFFGHIFEEVCMQYLKKCIIDGKIATLYTEFGSWWENNPKESREK